MNTALKVQSDQETKIFTNANELVEMAGRAVITNQADNEKASDLVKFIKTCYKKAEDDRKTITDPLNGVIKNINARYKLITEPLEKAEAKVKGLMLTYSQEQRRIAMEAERIARETEEKRLIEQAALLEQQNKIVESDMVMDKAAEVNASPIVAPQVQIVRGDYGSASSIKKTWTFEVTDMKALATEYPELVAVNSVAVRELIRSGIRDIAGLKIFEQESIVVR